MDKELLKLNIESAFSKLIELSSNEERKETPLSIRSGIIHNYEPDDEPDEIFHKTRLCIRSVISPYTMDLNFKVDIQTEQKRGEPFILIVEYLYAERTGISESIPRQHGVKLVKDIDISPEQVANFAESLDRIAPYRNGRLLMSKEAIYTFKAASKTYTDLVDLMQENGAREKLA